MAEPISFVRPPRAIVEGIPVFVERDAYVANYEAIAADHLDAERRTGHNPFIEESLWQQLEASTLGLVRQYSKPGDRILDVGVGLGRVLAKVPELERHGVDISLDYLRRSAAQGIHVALARVENLPYAPDTFDMVLATDFLEHVLDLNDAVRRMLEVLRPGGILIVRTPNREDLSEYVAPGFPYRYVHMRTFDRPSMILLFDRVFECQVLDVVEAGYVPHGPYLRWVMPLPKWRGIVSQLLLGPISRIHPRIGHVILPRFYNPVVINVAIRKPG